jgi:hypothetical protein
MTGLTRFDTLLTEHYEAYCTDLYGGDTSAGGRLEPLSFLFPAGFAFCLEILQLEMEHIGPDYPNSMPMNMQLLQGTGSTGDPAAGSGPGNVFNRQSRFPGGDWNPFYAAAPTVDITSLMLQDFGLCSAENVTVKWDTTLRLNRVNRWDFRDNPLTVLWDYSAPAYTQLAYFHVNSYFPSSTPNPLDSNAPFYAFRVKCQFRVAEVPYAG